MADPDDDYRKADKGSAVGDGISRGADGVKALTFQNSDLDGNGIISGKEAEVVLRRAKPQQQNGVFAQKVLRNFSTVDRDGSGIERKEANFAMGDTVYLKPVNNDSKKDNGRKRPVGDMPIGRPKPKEKPFMPTIEIGRASCRERVCAQV